MKKLILKSGLILVFSTGLIVSAFAGARQFPDLKVTITSFDSIKKSTSDYCVFFDYNGVGNVDCSWKRTHVIDIFKDTDMEDGIEYSVSGSTHKTSAHIELAVGPGSNHRWGLRYKEYGGGVSNCLEYAWSGFKKNEAGVWEANPATSVTDRDNWFSLGRYSVVIRAVTAPIKSPLSVEATEYAYFDKIVLKWKQGTDIPRLYHTYKIYRGITNNPAGADFLTEVTGSDSTWTDVNVNPNDVFYYWITTYTDKFPNVSESPRTTQNAVQGSTKTIIVNASDGNYVNSVLVKWDDLSSFFENIRIERSTPNATGRTELTVLGKYSTSYSDDGIIPGFRYTYYVTPIHSSRTFPANTDYGYVKPNGTISGNVKSLLGGGVDSVQICARPVTTIPAGAIPVPEEGYCTYTNPAGDFRIDNIYYYEEADIEVKPYKAGRYIVHNFGPVSTTIKLDINTHANSGLSFRDSSVFTIGGKVIYPVSGTGRECGVQNVEILVDGSKRNIYTNANGQWSYTIQQEGTYSFKPVFLQHRFANTTGQPESRILINDNVTDINFTDIQVDSIKVKVQSGCGTPVANYATVRVTSPNVCYDKQFNTDANGLLTVRDLPARIYDVQVTALNPMNSNAMNQIGNKPIRLDLSRRDSTDVISKRDSLSITPADTLHLPDGSIHITPADTVVTTITDTTRVEIMPKADFIYHSPLDVTPGWEEAGAEIVCQNVVLMEQNKDYKLHFNVNEQLGNCPVTEGVLRIYDQVSDRENTPVDVPIINGVAVYAIKAGLPKLSADNNHQKYLLVMPKVGFIDATPLTYWVMVTGAKSQTATFFTKSPEIPWLVLHDPPGDSSYVYVNQGTSITSFFTHEVLRSAEAGGYADVTVGYGQPGLRVGGVVKYQLTAGRDTLDRNGWKKTLTFEEGYSTSPSRGWIGHNGDVFIGASLNLEFSLADELYFDKINCIPKLRVIPSVNFTGFNTTFIYTEDHIKNTLIPTLRNLFDATLDGRDITQLDSTELAKVNEFGWQIKDWEDILARNDSNRGIKAKFEKNVSFSGGASYTSEMTSDSIISGGGEYHVVVNGNWAVGGKVENDIGPWVKGDLGYVAKFRYSDNTNSGTDSLFRRKVGYMLRDNDMGDFFSVDIKRDEVNGVPAFDLKLGTTSCPYEPGSQRRDKAYLTIYPNERRNVPMDGIATFEASLTNYSESREPRDYAVKVIPETNPYGARIKLGGVLINNNPVIYSVGPSQTLNVVVTVEKGPLTSAYDPIGIVMYPPCERNFACSDTAWIRVFFQSGCSPVWLSLPEGGWMVNQNNNNILNTAITGYDLNNVKLENITLQCKKDGDDWIDVVTIEKESLKDLFYDYPFNVSVLTDGSYSLRARSYCGAEGGYYYSEEKKGIIDRTTPAPFGYPSPSDGFLHQGDDISVSFDKNIDCSLSTALIKLLVSDGTEIPFTTGCFNNKIILTPQPEIFSGLPADGIMINATVENVKDLFGNVQKYPVNWSFRAVPAAQAPPQSCPYPGIQCPPNIRVASEPGLCGAQVFFPDVTPSPDCGGPGITIRQTGGFQSGYLYPVGVTRNSYLLTNMEGKTTECSFDISVYDNQPPVISDLSAELYPMWPPDRNKIPVELKYTASDNCGIADFEIFAMGSYRVNNTSTRKTPVPIVRIDQHHILLVAESSGPGEGREYTIYIRCRDAGGFYTQEQTTIFVPNENTILKSTGSADQTGLSPDMSAIKPAQFTVNVGNEPFMASVWPNPTKKNFNIEVISSNNKKIEVSVLDILGRMISTVDVNGSQPVPFGESLVPGVYFISVRQGIYLKNIKVIKQ